VLLYAAEYRTEGIIEPAIVREVVQGATAGFLERCEGLGLLERTATGELLIHDWHEFNGTGRERQLARDRKRSQRHRDGVLARAGFPRQSSDGVVSDGHKGVTSGVTKSQEMSRFISKDQDQDQPLVGADGENGARDDAANVSRLIALLGANEAQTDLVRELATRAGDELVLELLEAVGAGVIANPLGFVLDRLG
jgi:hypothetical protein